MLTIAMEQSLKISLLGSVKRGEVDDETVGCFTGPDGLGKQILINGGTYCRPHLKSDCHMCEVSYEHLHDEANSAREAHGLRPVGDLGLDASTWSIKDEVLKAQAVVMDEMAHLKATGQYGPSWRPTPAMRAVEDDINRRMAEPPRCTACAYYKCTIELAGDPHTSAGVELLTCTGCGIARYCSKECQRKDWRWEHKAECDWDGTLAKALAKAAPLRALRAISDDEDDRLQGTVDVEMQIDELIQRALASQ